MAADDILRMAVTVSVVQALCDIAARYFVYNGDKYRRACANLERAHAKYTKLEKEANAKASGGNTKQQDKVKKRLEMAKNDWGEAKAQVAKQHSGPGMLFSFIFIIMFRIVGAELHGKVMGIIPFVPWRLARKLTMRGLDFGDDVTGMAANMFQGSKGVSSVNQACSYMLIYFLCNMGVKFYVHKLVGEAPPPGADGGLLAVIESPAVAKGLRQMGLEPDDYKMD